MSETLREKILNASDLTSEIIEIPEWGIKAKLQSMRQGEKAKLMKDCTLPNGSLDPETFASALLIATLVDPLNGQPIFSPADRDALNLKSTVVVERVAKVAIRVCGLSDGGMEKNSERTESVATLSV